MSDLCAGRREYGVIWTAFPDQDYAESILVIKKRCPGCEDCGGNDMDQFGDLS